MYIIYATQINTNKYIEHLSSKPPNTSMSRRSLAVHWVIRHKARVRAPDQTLKRIMKKKNISSAFSYQQICGQKSQRVNRIAMKSFSNKNLSIGVDLKFYVLPLKNKINTHNISGVRNYVNNLDWRIVMTNYIMYVTSMRERHVWECTYTNDRSRVPEKARTRTFYFKNAPLTDLVGL